MAIISQELDFRIIVWLSRYKICPSKFWNTWLITACNHYLTIFKGSHLLWTLIKCPLNLLKEGSIKFRLKIWIKITFTACICWPKLTVRLSLTSGTSSRHCFVRSCVSRWSWSGAILSVILQIRMIIMIESQIWSIEAIRSYLIYTLGIKSHKKRSRDPMTIKKIFETRRGVRYECSLPYKNSNNHGLDCNYQLFKLIFIGIEMR